MELMTTDTIGARMKDFYESRSSVFLPRRTYTIIRIDGKAFHTYTRGLKRPFDEGFIKDMDITAKDLCKEVQGVVMGYVQSDEISLVLSDFAKFATSAWFDGNVQKMCSVSASIATASFNRARVSRALKLMQNNALLNSFNPYSMKWATFDSRAFVIPSKEEVINYLVWRQNDATRNSISSVAQSMFSSKELHGKCQKTMQEMIFQKSGQNWNDFPAGQKRGRAVVKRTAENFDYNTSCAQLDGAEIESSIQEKEYKGGWAIENPPIFSKEKSYLGDLFNNLEANMEGKEPEGDD